MGPMVRGSRDPIRAAMRPIVGDTAEARREDRRGEHEPRVSRLGGSITASGVSERAVAFGVHMAV